MVPIYKKADKTKPENYRPLALTSNIAKIYEKAYYVRLEKFVIKNKIIIQEQFGFQKNKATAAANAEAMKLIVKNLEDKKKKQLGIFLDMSKAFDCVDHKNLLMILENYGIRGVGNSWLKSYLIGRTQWVAVEEEGELLIEEITSKFLTTVFGVPQGSILGPLLFLIYINEIKSFITINFNSECHPILYADDITLIISGGSIEDLIEITKEVVIKIKTYLASLNLVVNISRTQCLFFTLKNRNGDFKLSIEIEDTHIQESDCSKFLGITLDKGITWRGQTSEVIKKLRSGNFVLKQLAQSMAKKYLIMAHYAFIYSHLSYGTIMWGCAPKVELNKIFSL